MIRVICHDHAYIQPLFEQGLSRYDSDSDCDIDMEIVTPGATISNPNPVDTLPDEPHLDDGMYYVL